MITRKENLLTQPFQHRKYMQHRFKVNTALPRIDDINPAERNHVYLKCKKLQIEAERQCRIERDNFILLKHLSDIMTAKRIDNSWFSEPPKFQHRVKLFRNRSSKPTLQTTQSVEKTEKLPKRLKKNCSACNPDKFITPVKIPEERVPWETKMHRDLHWSRNKNEIYNLSKKSKETEIPDIRKSQLNRRRQKRIPSTGCDYKSISRHFPNNLQESHQVRERPLTIVVKLPTMR